MNTTRKVCSSMLTKYYQKLQNNGRLQDRHLLSEWDWQIRKPIHRLGLFMVCLGGVGDA
jgi:hypothetical protein